MVHWLRSALNRRKWHKRKPGIKRWKERIMYSTEFTRPICVLCVQNEGKIIVQPIEWNWVENRIECYEKKSNIFPFLAMKMYCMLNGHIFHLCLFHWIKKRKFNNAPTTTGLLTRHIVSFFFLLFCFLYSFLHVTIRVDRLTNLKIIRSINVRIEFNNENSIIIHYRFSLFNVFMCY